MTRVTLEGQSGRRVCGFRRAPYLDLARAVAQGSPLAGGEHGDHLVQASLQRTEHLSPPLLRPAVVCDRHVQRPRPGRGKPGQKMTQSRLQVVSKRLRSWCSPRKMCQLGTHNHVTVADKSTIYISRNYPPVFVDYTQRIDPITVYTPTCMLGAHTPSVEANKAALMSFILLLAPSSSIFITHTHTHAHVSTHLRSGLKASISTFASSLNSTTLFLLCSLEALPPPATNTGRDPVV